MRSPTKLAYTVQYSLDRLGIAASPQIDNASFRVAVQGNKVFPDPVAYVVALEQRHNFIELAHRKYDVWSGCAVRRDAQRLVRGRVNHVLFLSREEWRLAFQSILDQRCLLTNLKPGIHSPKILSAFSRNNS